MLSDHPTNTQQIYYPYTVDMGVIIYIQQGLLPHTLDRGAIIYSDPISSLINIQINLFDLMIIVLVDLSLSSGHVLIG